MGQAARVRDGASSKSERWGKQPVRDGANKSENEDTAHHEASERMRRARE